MEYGLMGIHKLLGFFPPFSVVIHLKYSWVYFFQFGF